jgi:hypothetical protein
MLRKGTNTNDIIELSFVVNIESISLLFNVFNSINGYSRMLENAKEEK